MINPTLAARLAAAAFALVAGVASASGDNDLRMEPAPVNRLDAASLQRGARNFVNYCLGCHSAKYMRYSRLTDLGLTEEQVRENLILGDAKIGDTMGVSMRAADAKAWFGAPPPDLSVESRVRGRDWLYNYLIGFYRDDAAPSGWNNLVFPNVAMPHVLWTLSGPNRLQVETFADHHEAEAAAIAAKGLVRMEPAAGGKTAVMTVQTGDPGAMTAIEYKLWVADLVNFMEYMGEPARNKRIQLGMIVLLYLGLLFVLVYALKREFWKDVH
jgi:ubiquinol-cytochrome c reductase cytochrome c1 subunit